MAVVESALKTGPLRKLAVSAAIPLVSFASRMTFRRLPLVELNLGGLLAEKAAALYEKDKEKMQKTFQKAAVTGGKTYDVDKYPIAVSPKIRKLAAAAAAVLLRIAARKLSGKQGDERKAALAELVEQGNEIYRGINQEEFAAHAYGRLAEELERERKFVDAGDMYLLAAQEYEDGKLFAGNAVAMRKKFAAMMISAIGDNLVGD
ncbi:hypothetical protein COT30_04700 [Candidatus Micrarchaeota archaeon CG08_land_8_20_14_0_20_49_17]|nr:MAG: hypothetical protein COT30_04700 [Candidatus Micrarchaeota archaeon CG08_land_8_20_14_0_20_49_17]